MRSKKIEVGEYKGKPYILIGDRKYSYDVLYNMYVNQGISTVSLGKLLGCSRPVINRALNKIGIPLRTPAEAGKAQVLKYNYKEDLFTKLTTDSCYIVGLLMADGHLNDRRVHIYLAEEDRQILEDISLYVLREKSVGTIKSMKPTEQNKAKLVFNNRDYIKQLNELGVKSGVKTGNEKFIDFNNRGLQWSFIRGYFDGDGHVRVYKRNGYNKIKVSFTCANLEFLEDLKHYLLQEGIKIPKKAIQQKVGCYSLEFSSLKESKKFKKMLYNYGYLCLERKYKEFLLLDDIV